MSDWYDKYIAGVEKEAEYTKPVDEVGQNILRMKSIGSIAFDDGQHCTTFGGDGEETKRFGFTEAMVNQLMQYAYDQGAKGISKRSYDTGYHQCRVEFLKSIDALDPEDN